MGIEVQSIVMKQRIRLSRFVRRIFVLEDDGSIRRIPAASFERLQRHVPEAAFAEYANRAVRSAVLDVELVRGRPTEIYACDYGLLYFDRHGRLDRVREAEYKRLGDRILRALARSTERRPFAGLDHPACKRMTKVFCWTPPVQIDAEIRRLALAARKRSVGSQTPSPRPSSRARLAPKPRKGKAIARRLD
jgi:hypothetical protein